MMHRMTGVVVVLMLLSGAGCKISEQDEMKLGRDNHAKFEQEFGGRYNNPPVQQYVNSIGMSLARYAGRPNLDWQFHVLASDQINAFAVPGGYIYITQGLLYRLNNEAQLAGVLGHEAGHIKHRHSVEQIQKAQIAQGSAGVAGVVGAVFGVGGVGDLVGVAAQLSLLKYGRDQEREADFSGLNYMSQGGWNPQGIVQTMQILKAASGPSGGQPSFLLSHPDPGDRAEYLAKEIREKYSAAAQGGKLGAPEFQANVLSKRRAALPAINLSRPVAWCFTCQTDEVNRVVSGNTPTRENQELLRAVRSR